MRIDFPIRSFERAMKSRFPEIVVCLLTSLTPVAGGLCYGGGNGSSTNANSAVAAAGAPAGSEVPVPPSFVGSSPWSEPPVAAPAETIPSKGAPSPATPAPNSPLAASIPRMTEFVSEDDVSAAIRGIAQQSAQLTAEGLRLAGKGAAYSARAKFIGALELIADALDARHQTQFHSRALAAGLLALREA